MNTLKKHKTLHTQGIPSLALVDKDRKRVFLYKQDVISTMELVLGHKQIRKLAEAMAPTPVLWNLRLLESHPEIDRSCDLANRIDRKSITKGGSLLQKKNVYVVVHIHNG